MGDILDTEVKLGSIESDVRCEVVKKRPIWSFGEVFPFHNVVNESFQFGGVCDHRLWHCLYSWTMLPSDEKAVSDSHVASLIGYPFHLM